MSANLALEGPLILLKDLGEEMEIPSRVAGQFVCYETVRQWADRGRKGVRLETILVGGSRMTTRRAYLRFVQRLNGAASGPSGGGMSGRESAPRAPLTPRQRRARQAAVEQALREEGVIE